MILRWWRLAIRNWRARFTRTLLESIAVVIACALIVMLSCGFAAAERTFWVWRNRWVGAVDVRVSSATGRWMDESILDRLSAVDGVTRVAGGFRDHGRLVSPTDAASISLKARQIPASLEFQPMEFVAGGPPEAGDSRQVVLDVSLAEKLNVSVGDTVKTDIYHQVSQLEVVGVIAEPPMLSFIPRTAHVSLQTAQAILHRPGKIEVVYVDFDDAVGRPEQLDRLRAALGPGYDLAHSADRTGRIAENFRMIRAVLNILYGLLLALAAFLIFAALAGGLVPRMRELGMLRCVGASRRHLGALVVLESLPVALWGIVLGVPLGLLGAWGLARLRPDLFLQGWQVSRSGIAMAAIGSTAATLCAAALPALAAARMTPVRAYRPRGVPTRRWVTGALTCAGVVFTVVPLWMVYSTTDPWTALGQHATIGLPMLLVGHFLLAPWLLWLIAHPLGRGLGVLLRIHPSLIARQVLRTRWRSAALVVAVGMCVGLVVRGQTETESMLAGVELPDNFPDLLVIMPTGVEREEAARQMKRLGVAEWTGVNGFDIRIEDDAEVHAPSTVQRLMQWRGGNAWYLAIEDEHLHRLSTLDFIEGDAQTAVRRLAESDAVVVAEAFATARNVHAGDVLPVRDWEGKIIGLEIVGVVNSLSLESAGSAYSLGDMYLRNARLTVMGSYSTAAERFDHGSYSVLLAHTDTTRQSRRIGAALTEAWRDRPVQYLPLKMLKRIMEREYRRFTSIISAVVGVLAAAVASVGVANAMQAGVHNRRRELGVLHAVGMTRWQLTRLIGGEAAVIGVTGAVGGVLCGVYGSYMGMRIAGLFNTFQSVLTVPLRPVLWSVVLAVGATLIASVVAAIRAGRVGVLDLMAQIDN